MKMDRDSNIIPANLTLAEQLTLNFYNWEKRGRGLAVWDQPVMIEPVFEPFTFNLPIFQPAIDDGRHHTWLSQLMENISSAFSDQSPSVGQASQELEDEEDEKPEVPVFYGEVNPLCEFTLSLPSKHKTEFEVAENFLLSLNASTFYFSFEIIGTSEAISIQMTCRDTEAFILKQQLKAFFPDAVLYEESPVLPSLWDKEKPSAVCDFVLGREFMRPLRTYRKFEPDPLTSLIGSMDNLEKGELAVFQVLFQSVRNNWADSILQSVTDFEGHSFFANDHDMLRLAREKIERPLFAAVVRIGCQSPDEYRTHLIERAMSSGLHQFSNPPSNEIASPIEDYDKALRIADLLSRQTHRSGMLLNSAELVSMVHLPSVSVRAARLRRELKKTKAAPDCVAAGQLLLGENIHQGGKSPVKLTSDQRMRHVHIVGATGTGKSTLLLNMIVQDIKSGHGLAVLDPHGDLIERVLGHIPEERFEDVVLLDPSDSEYPVGLNILSAYSEIDKTVLASDLVGVFRRLSTSWGDQMNSIFSNAVLAFLESGRGGTLHDLRRFLVEKSFRESFLQSVRDKEVVYYWQKEFPLLIGKAQAPILTRLDTFLRPKPIRNMVIQKEGLNFQDILDSRKILLAKLSQGLIGMENAFLLGTILVSKLHQAAMARQTSSEAERKDFYLYVDEFQNFATKSMAEILSGGRKYRFGLVLAHQDMRQLLARDDELASSVISNAGTRICFRLGDFDAKKLEEGFSYFEANDLQNLGIGEAVARVGQSDHDFNLTTAPPAELPEDIARSRREKVIGLSRQKHACPLEKLEIQDTSPPAPPTVKDEKVEAEQSSLGATEKPARKPATEKEELQPEEISFLKFLSRNPEMFVTKLYEALSLSGYKGDKLKSDLIEKGLIVQKETRQGLLGRLAKVLALTDRGDSVVKNLSLPGKGGDLHKDLQEIIKEQAELYGWKAKVEKRIPRSLESVDVDLAKDGIRVAVEISSTTTPEHEVQNVKKCLEAGYDYVLAVCSDDNHLNQLKTEVKKAFTFKERERISCFHSSRVKEFLISKGQAVIVSENGIVSGQVKEQKQLLDSAEAAEFLGISKNTLYEWRALKKIPYVKVGGLLKFKRTELEKWLEKRTQEEERFEFSDE